MIWKETKSAEEMAAEREAEAKREAEIEIGLARCSVCGGRAKIERFGARGDGIWIGCDRTERCVPYIEVHSEGWSVEEVAAEWNRYNSGMYRAIRKVKRWFRERYGERARTERRWEKEKTEREKARQKERETAFGGKSSVKMGGISGFLRKILQKRGN